MNNSKARSFVTITITIAIVALLLRFGIENLIKFNIKQNEENAVNTLNSISTALENYAKNNVGIYPVSLAILTQTKPQYLTVDYTVVSPVKGYVYTFSRLDPYGYSCRATPDRCSVTGKSIYTITTGGIKMPPESCSKKEES
ncbi:MAG: hypothetical protein WDL87_06900 [Candidatus Omnitrophota bacterium]|jgi:type II secretory pathway pseudopilin PulG